MPAQANANVVALQLEKVHDKVPLLYERDDILLTMIQQRGSSTGSLLREVVELRQEPKYPAVNRWQLTQLRPCTGMIPSCPSHLARTSHSITIACS